MGDSASLIHFVIAEREKVPFNQSVVKQTNTQAAYGPDANQPYFTVRFAIPIPPAYTPAEQATLTGMEHGVYHHNHSPGFEIMPNGDALAVYFSSPAGKSENDTAATFVQARLRYGSEDWDMPEVFFDTQFGNDQSGLLWNDKGKIWFFGGGRYISDYVPFKIAVSTDNGASWTFSVPQLDTAASDFTAQPVVNAFRDPRGGIYIVSDGTDSESFLWYSADEGKSWKDMGGRTGSRHSTILPLDDKGTLLAQGGKNADIEGWNVRNISHDWGASWDKGTASPFPPLGSVQRPSMIRLASGNLLYVTDSYMHKKNIAPPAGWKYGNDAVVGISKDNGQTWHIKPLPVQLPQRHRPPHGSLGYSTARQAPNGVIHILTTANFPPIHYELNEAWIWSDLAEITPESDGGEVKGFTESYKDGRLKSAWSAR
ncbi:MAG: sialidase family protein, partial [Bacteroidales bacterium]|nr:sialidase family protein [Bacteroidales bacterium]